MMKTTTSLSPQDEFDAIVIGSGIGGLTVAAILSKFNQKKVLILEQHFIVGGFTQEFKRREFQWDVGLHYVGEMGEGSFSRAISDYITEGRLKWQKMPDLFEKIIYPDFSFEVYSDPQKYQADLIKMFPEEKVGIKRYFSDLQKVNNWYGLRETVSFLPDWLSYLLKPFIRLWGRAFQLTTKQYLDRNFQNPRLKALLASQWGTYGLPPSQSAFGIHALVMSSFLHGGWYPVGGAQAIAENIVPVIEAGGGKVLTQQSVVEIIIKDGVAVGVKAKKSQAPAAEIEEYYAPAIISDAGAFNTYTKLIPEQYAAAYRQAIQTFPKGYSVLVLFLGLKESPEKLGFQGEQYWIYTSYDHDSALEQQLASPEQGINSCYLSFPSMKDPTAQSPTAEIMAFADYDCFAKWQEQPWRKRDPDYYELKDRLAQIMIDFVNRHHPGFKDIIEYSELATPLTMAYFDESERGTIYGIPSVPARFEQPWIGVKTPLKNLYLTGADALSPGIIGAMMGGVMAAATLNGASGYPKIMAAIEKESASR
jgi:phytoene dehydrogenase-like protein